MVREIYLQSWALSCSTCPRALIQGKCRVCNDLSFWIQCQLSTLSLTGPTAQLSTGISTPCCLQNVRLAIAKTASVWSCTASASVQDYIVIHASVRIARIPRTMKKRGKLPSRRSSRETQRPSSRRTAVYNRSRRVWKDALARRVDAGRNTAIASRANFHVASFANA